MEPVHHTTFNDETDGKVLLINVSELIINMSFMMTCLEKIYVHAHPTLSQDEVKIDDIGWGQWQWDAVAMCPGLVPYRMVAVDG